MRYWDSSALVALFVEQAATQRVRELWAQDSGVITWSLSEVEIVSALVRLERDVALDAARFDEAVAQLAALWDTVDAVTALDAVKARTRRLLRSHPLRAADALQLGAALVAASDDPRRWSFVCLDDRLGAAARREGFTVVP